jgi:hypothetical protein
VRREKRRLVLNLSSVRVHAVRVLITALALAVAACGGSGDPANGKPAAVELVKPTGEAPYDRTFVWKAVPGATSYRVVVFNSAGERSFEVRDVKGTSVAVAASVGLPAAHYSWQVLAFKAEQQISESAVTGFDIK